MILKPFIPLFILCAAATQLCGQTLVVNWAKTYGGTGYHFLHDMVTDDSGYIYSSGVYAGKTDLDPGPDSFFVSSTANSNVFVQKLDKNGNFVWGRSIGGVRNEFSAGLAVDASGNVFVQGMYDSTVNFHPSGDISGIRSSRGRLDPFIVKFDKNGQYIWTLSDGRAGNDYPTAIKCDEAGNVFVSGYYDPDADIQNGSYDSYLTKYSASGTKIWNAVFPGGTGGFLAIGSKSIRDFEIGKNGSLYLCGEYYKTMDANPGTAEWNLTSKGLSDVFIIKLNAAAQLVWVRTSGGKSYDYAPNIHVDKYENVYVAGSFKETADLDPTGYVAEYISKGSEDIFLQKLDSNGYLKWVRTIGGKFDESVYDIQTDDTANVFLAGFYSDIVDFDPGIKSNTKKAFGVADIFIQKSDSTGSFKWLYTTGSINNDIATSLSFDPNQNLVCGGVFSNTVDFGNAGLKFNASSEGNYDNFILKFKTCQTTYGNSVLNACNSFVYKNKTYTESTMINDTLVNFSGCDSIHSIHLLIHEVNTVISRNYDTLFANRFMDSFQWVDCDSNKIIAGQNEHFFKPGRNGRFAVIVYNNDCFDTSDCYELQTVTTQSSKVAGLGIYPNPVHGKIYLTGGQQAKHAEVWDLDGKKTVLEIDDNVVLVKSLTAGVYIIKIDTDSGSLVQKLIVQ